MNPIDYNPGLPQGFSMPFSLRGIGSLAHVSPNALWIVFFLVAVVTILVSAVLHYHWLRYGMADKGVLLAQILYTLVVLTACIVMIGSISYYGASL